jgi:hypothetical protein
MNDNDKDRITRMFFSVLIECIVVFSMQNQRSADHKFGLD